MNIEILAFEIDNGTEKHRTRLAEALRAGCKDAIGELKQALETRRDDWQRVACDNFEQLTHAQRWGIVEKPHDKYGWLNYHDIIHSMIVERQEIDRFNWWRLSKLPSGNFLYEYSFDVYHEGSFGGVWLQHDLPSTRSDAVEQLAKRAIDWYKKRKAAKKYVHYYENLLCSVSNRPAQFAQLSLF